jgi:acetoin:2,6-dichlorophenolindophenol oxidoreductase subunit beta
MTVQVGASSGVSGGPARNLKYVHAINEGLAQALRSDDAVFLIGEDVTSGGVFTAYKGLVDEFGTRRIVDSPLAEAGLVGLGVGAAAAGCRPIVDIMFMDFIGLCMDQLVNQAAKMKYMFGGSLRMPLTVLAMSGAGTSMGAQHSQSLESWLCHVPGLKVVMPSGPVDAKGLLLSAIRDDNATVVVFNKQSLGISASVPEEDYELPLGQAVVVRSGTDATVVAMGRMVQESLSAAEILEQEGTAVEVIDLRTLSPLDTATIVTSVRRTNRAVVAHEAVRFGGFGAEVASQIQEQAFDYLDAPVARVGAPFAPVPFAPELERLYVPDRQQIAAAIRGTLVGRPS